MMCDVYDQVFGSLKSNNGEKKKKLKDRSKKIYLLKNLEEGNNEIKTYLD